MYECELVQIFIKNVYEWINNMFSFDIIACKKEYILGCAENEISNIINYHLKYYIYCCRCQNKMLMLNSFKMILSNVYNIELKLAKRNNYVEIFLKKWKNFEQPRII